MTAQRLARAFPISGYVKNLPDGRVEVLVDGDGSQIARFLGALRSEFDGYIERLTEEPAPVDAPHLESFEIRY